MRTREKSHPYNEGGTGKSYSNGYDPNTNTTDSQTWLNARIQAEIQAKLDPLRDECAKIQSDILEFSKFNIERDKLEEERSVKTAMLRLEQLAAQAEREIASITQQANNANKSTRKFSVDWGVWRGIKRPNTFKTFIMISTCWTLETGLTAGSLFADGHMSVPVAGMFAGVFASVNVGLGIFAGWVARLRNFRKQHINPRPEDKKIRQAGKYGFIILSIIEAMMMFVAGRTRVTGEHDRVFDFSEYSFWSTFGDGIALVIMIAAGISFIVAASKGYSGFKDEIPEFEDYAGTTQQDFDEDAEDVVDESLEDIDDVLDEAKEDIENLYENLDDIKELPERVGSFNTKIVKAKGAIVTAVQREIERINFVEGVQIERPEIDWSDFNSLMIEPGSVSEAPLGKSQLDNLYQAHADATARISAAIEKYRKETAKINSHPSFI